MPPSKYKKGALADIGKFVYSGKSISKVTGPNARRISSCSGNSKSLLEKGIIRVTKGEASKKRAWAYGQKRVGLRDVERQKRARNQEVSVSRR